jgi:proline dehydrogenase
MRAVLLAASESGWLRHHATRWGFVRRATRRFMPGERLEEALAAAQSLGRHGIGALLTHLGENVVSADESRAVADHYVGAQDAIRASGLTAETSVKLTQLGLDLGRDHARANLLRLAEHAAGLGQAVWVDMEGSAYTDVTLELFHQVHRERNNVGICVQSYLRRTERDLESLLAMGAAVRLVKGAYREPTSLAFRTRREVAASYLRLAQRMLSREARAAGVFPGFGTHDEALIERIRRHAESEGAPKESFEFELLYGIRRDLQTRLAAEAHRVRVLISYGESWYPWYMRRLAERPANVAFVLRNLFGG